MSPRNQKLSANVDGRLAAHLTLAGAALILVSKSTG